MAANETKAGISEAPAGLFVFIIVFIEIIMSIFITPVSTSEPLMAIMNPEKGKMKLELFIPDLKNPIFESRTIMGCFSTG